MENWVIYTAKQVTEQMLKDWVVSQGGQWHDRRVGSEGVLVNGDAAVYLASGHDFDELDERETAESRRRPGGQPRTWISIQIGHAPASWLLAERAASQLPRSWGGPLDRSESRGDSSSSD